MFQTKILKIN